MIRPASERVGGWSDYGEVIAYLAPLAVMVALLAACALGMRADWKALAAITGLYALLGPAAVVGERLENGAWPWDDES